MPTTFTLNGEARHQRRSRKRHGPLGPPRATRPDRNPVRLRGRRVRRLHGPPRRSAGAILQTAAVPRRGDGKSPPSRASRRTGPTPCNRPGSREEVPQCGYCQSGQLMQAREPAGGEPVPDARGDRRTHGRHPLPLRNLRPDHPRDRTRLRRWHGTRREDAMSTRTQSPPRDTAQSRRTFLRRARRRPLLRGGLRPGRPGRPPPRHPPTP